MVSSATSASAAELVESLVSQQHPEGVKSQQMSARSSFSTTATGDTATAEQSSPSKVRITSNQFMGGCGDSGRWRTNAQLSH